jgi:hypothetical protein
MYSFDPVTILLSQLLEGATSKPSLAFLCFAFLCFALSFIGLELLRCPVLSWSPGTEEAPKIEGGIRIAEVGAREFEQPSRFPKDLRKRRNKTEYRRLETICEVHCAMNCLGSSS